jgi:hypothetical protein
MGCGCSDHYRSDVAGGPLHARCSGGGSGPVEAHEAAASWLSLSEVLWWLPLSTFGIDPSLVGWTTFLRAIEKRHRQRSPNPIRAAGRTEAVFGTRPTPSVEGKSVRWAQVQAARDSGLLARARDRAEGFEPIGEDGKAPRHRSPRGTRQEAADDDNWRCETTSRNREYAEAMSSEGKTLLNLEFLPPVRLAEAIAMSGSFDERASSEFPQRPGARDTFPGRQVCPACGAADAL